MISPYFHSHKFFYSHLYTKYIKSYVIALRILGNMILIDRFTNSWLDTPI